MAKAKKVVEKIKEIPVLSKKPVVLENGKAYKNLTEYRISTKGNVIPAGFTLRECSDGWYQLFDLNDEKYYFRIGPKLLAILPGIHKIR